MLIDEMQVLPKVELHLHLDCSLSYSVASRLNPELTTEEYQRRFIAPVKCNDLADFLNCAPSGINLMQTAEQLRLVVSDLFEQLKQDHIVYAEIRFGPLLHLDKGLSPEAAVEVVADEVTQNISRTGIQAGIILSTLRNYSEDESLEVVKLVKKYMDATPVAGFDIAGDEAGYPIDSHKSAFKYAIAHDIPRTAHAGEARGAESVWNSIEYFKPTRIGHGVRSTEDPRLIEYLVEQGIHLEVCPTCNIQTSIYATFQDHPVDKLVRNGVNVGINTDARTLVHTTLTEEYEKLIRTFGWDLSTIRKCNLNAIDAAFAEDSVKTEIKEKIIKWTHINA